MTRGGPSLNSQYKTVCQERDEARDALATMGRDLAAAEGRVDAIAKERDELIDKLRQERMFKEGYRDGAALLHGKLDAAERVAAMREP